MTTLQRHLRNNRIRRIRRRVIELTSDVTTENEVAKREDRNPSTWHYLEQLDRLKFRLREL